MSRRTGLASSDSSSQDLPGPLVDHALAVCRRVPGVVLAEVGVAAQIRAVRERGIERAGPLVVRFHWAGS
jgi:hypothetical protein